MLKFLLVVAFCWALCDGRGRIVAEDDSLEPILATVPCIKQLSAKYFKSEREMKGSLAMVMIKPNTSYFQLAMLRLLNHDPNHEVSMMVKTWLKFHTNKIWHVTHKVKNYFLFVSNSSDVDALGDMLRHLPTWNPNTQVVLVITDQILPQDLEFEVWSTLKKLMDRELLNVNVLVQRYNTRVLESWTWFPFENDGCGDEIVTLRMIDSCEYVEVPVEKNSETKKEDLWKGSDLLYFNQTLMDNSSIEPELQELEDAEDIPQYTTWIFREQNFFPELFPKIPKEFNYCPLKITTTIWEPYVVGNATHVDKGLEVLLIKAVTTRMKLTPVYTVIEAERATAEIVADNTTGFYADLIQRKTDIMIGGLFENPVSRKVVSSSIPYYQDDLTWCVPPAQIAPKWLNVFIIFNIWIWLVSIGIVMFSALLIYWLNFFEDLPYQNYTWTVVQSLAISLSVYAHYWPQKVSTQTFLLIYMFYGLHFGVFYHSFLLSVMTRPRFERQISTAEAALESGFDFAGAENTLVYFDKPGVSRKIAPIYQICKNMDDCLDRLHSERTLAVAISRAHSSNSKSIGEGDMFCFSRSDNIQTYTVAMMGKRFFYLIPIINDHIRRIIESGLFGKWLVECMKIRVDDDSEGGGEGEVQIVLTVEHVMGGFILVIIGLAVGFVAFVGEIVYFRVQQTLNWKENMFTRVIC
ncbi:uncharacterized protein LOC129738048 [Uranotaenia lowii]|uniref:uncharacterized protein LOC129738048 n=1 Tax=Uranotaenia lowii TaxID=190385 RepID=UPI002479370A|nr:uncharacterized protein LOC129738048 [Uranotaenia lowii]